MTQHLHGEFVEGCYRCDLSRDELRPDWMTYETWIVTRDCAENLARHRGLAFHEALALVQRTR